jgi:hypothetical protein
MINGVSLTKGKYLKKLYLINNYTNKIIKCALKVYFFMIISIGIILKNLTNFLLKINPLC